MLSLASKACAIPNVVASPENEIRLNEALRDLERVLNDNEDYREALDNIHASYKSEMQIIREDDQKKINFLVAEIERLHSDADRLRSDAEHWRYENDRKGKLIDKYMEKIVSR